jgi:hypothetical protein
MATYSDLNSNALTYDENQYLSTIYFTAKAPQTLRVQYLIGLSNSMQHLSSSNLVGLKLTTTMFR